MLIICHFPFESYDEELQKWEGPTNEKKKSSKLLKIKRKGEVEGIVFAIVNKSFDSLLANA